MYRCYNCGKTFSTPKIVYESRGEYWGIPCTETMYYSPCCGDEDFDEIKEDEEDD